MANNPFALAGNNSKPAFGSGNMSNPFVSANVDKTKEKTTVFGTGKSNPFATVTSSETKPLFGGSSAFGGSVFGKSENTNAFGQTTGTPAFSFNKNEEKTKSSNPFAESKTFASVAKKDENVSKSTTPFASNESKDSTYAENFPEPKKSNPFKSEPKKAPKPSKPLSVKAIGPTVSKNPFTQVNTKNAASKLGLDPKYNWVAPHLRKQQPAIERIQSDENQKGILKESRSKSESPNRNVTFGENEVKVFEKEMKPKKKRVTDARKIINATGLNFCSSMKGLNFGRI